MLKTSPHPAWFLTTVLEAKSVTVESKPSVGSSDMVRGSGSLPSSSVLSCLPPQGLNVNPKWATYTFTTETPGTGLGEPWKPKQRKAGETETAARVETQPSHDNQARPLPWAAGTQLSRTRAPSAAAAGCLRTVLFRGLWAGCLGHTGSFCFC